MEVTFPEAVGQFVEFLVVQGYLGPLMGPRQRMFRSGSASG